MKIVVASRNPVKVAAATCAFRTLFPDEEIEVEPIEVNSGVGDQPNSDESTRLGARTRVLGSRKFDPSADFWIGFEGGVQVIDDQLMAFAWIAVQGRVGEVSEARSPTLPLPPAVKDLLACGLELGEANDRVFSTVNSKQGGGAFGLLTNGRYTREDIYAQTLIFALTPFVNPLYPQSRGQ